MRKPNTDATMAARSERPKLTLSAASDPDRWRCEKPVPADPRGPQHEGPRGKRTMRPSRAAKKPSVTPKPGITFGVCGLEDAERRRHGSALADLIEDAAIVEIVLLYVVPVALSDSIGEQFQVSAGRRGPPGGRLALARPIAMLREDA